MGFIDWLRDTNTRQSKDRALRVAVTIVSFSERLLRVAL